MTSKTKKVSPSAAENAKDASPSADDPRGGQLISLQQKGAQLLNADCDGSDSSAGGEETIKTNKMRVKRLHEGHELHKTKRRLTEILATVHEVEELKDVDQKCRPAVKLHALKQESADDVTMHRRLQREHLKLQKHFALVQSKLAETSKRHAKQVSDLEDELRDTRERHDLIEFQLLEIEQCQLKGIGRVAEKGVNTFLAGRCCQYDRFLQDQTTGNITSVENAYNNSELQQSEEIQNRFHDRTIRTHNTPLTQQELQEKMSSLVKAEKQLVTRNLKLYIQELQKIVEKKDNDPQVCLNTDTTKRGDEEAESHCISIASEDEGLGEDSRRDESTGPSSLVLDPEEYQGHFDGVIVDLRKRETSLVSHLCQAEARISELQDRLNVKEEQVLKLLSESCNYAMMQQQLSLTEQKRSELQEQVLELEEAENDSRSEAQRLQMVVLTMEERERLLEDEIHRTRMELEKCECQLQGMEITDRELQAQVSYTEALVCKYEKHIEELESAETDLHQKIVQLQYQLRIAKTGKVDCKSSFSQTLNIHSRTVDAVHIEDRHTQTDVGPSQEPSSFSTSCRDSLVFRLQQLQEKDGVLREQLHQMDGINLMLWQKLHSLDSNIELCKKQERRNFPEETKHQVAAARLDDLLISPSSKKQENQTHLADNLRNSLEQSELRNRLTQLEREHDHMQTNLEAKTLEHDEVIQRIEREKGELEKKLEKVQFEKEKLQETFLNASQIQNDNQKCQHLTFAVNQLKDEETTLRSDFSEYQVQTKEMCSGFELRLKDFVSVHKQKEDSWKNENAILKEKEREYQEELQSLRETRKSLKSEIGVMIQEKNAVLFELQKKLINLEEKKRSHHRSLDELYAKSYRDKCTQSDGQLQIQCETSTDIVASEKKHEILVETDVPKICETAITQRRETEMETEVSADCVHIELPCPESTKESISTIKELREKEQTMERRINELQQKESAYIETLENADKIISNLERGYQEKIVQLESSDKNLRQRISELEESENQLREIVNQPRRSSEDGWRISDLVKELIETEARENALKEHADEVEASHRTLLQKLREFERSNQQFREESQEQEEMLGILREKERELRTELTTVQQSESALRLTLHQADEILAQREQSVLEQVECLEKEKQKLEDTVNHLQNEMAVLKVTNDRVKNTSITKTTEQLDSKIENRPPVSLEDLNVGLDARLELEECMTRAMAAMERDMERKSSMDERENIRSSDSTSGCESDCSSTHIWPNSEDSDSDHAMDEPRPKKILIASSEIIAPVPTKIIYPTGTFTRMDKKSKITHDKNAPGFAGEKDTESKARMSKKANQDSTNQISCILPPENFSILRQVGKDSLLVGWKPRVSKSACISYQIFVDGQLQQNIRSPDRTKALLHKLDLSEPRNLSIQSISAEGDVSEPACAFFTASTQISPPSVKV